MRLDSEKEQGGPQTFNPCQAGGLTWNPGEPAGPCSPLSPAGPCHRENAVVTGRSRRKGGRGVSTVPPPQTACQGHLQQGQGVPEPQLLRLCQQDPVGREQRTQGGEEVAGEEGSC